MTRRPASLLAAAPEVSVSAAREPALRHFGVLVDAGVPEGVGA